MSGKEHKTLVLGLGNPLLGDDGVGLEALRVLEEQYLPPEDIDFVDGGTMGLYLLDRVAGYPRVLIADSVALGKAPGTVVRLVDGEVEAVFSTCLSPHQVGVNDLLAALALMGQRPAQVVVVGMVPDVMEVGVGLSDVVAHHLDAMIALLVGELRSWGHTLQRIED